MTILSSKITYLLEVQNKSMTDLAKYLNVALPTASRYASGKVSIKAEIIPDIANFFNVSTDFLFGRDATSTNIFILNFSEGLHTFKEVQLSPEEYSKIKDIIDKY